ncbi:MAG: transketolase [Nevskiaceae bacterium]|nr:MAG: transketolase [Nevskiaceae bacterium]TBR73169.1 MAG: transketolase [Nevskiaceae bacterium]
MPTRFELANAIRALAMDAVQQANSGHPGMPMGMADIAEVLWNTHLSHNPANPRWFNRDRFVVSNGHGSMLLYACLHLAGYDLPLAELRNFRQLHSKTPGHPEYGITPGVETTTGPLGQGISNAVGMALAERVLAAEFNRDGFPVVDHHTWVFCGDGCLMEGISHEAASIAGTLGLGKLVMFYDDNGISIDGEVKGWFRDDTPARFEAYGWQVIRNVDGHDPAEIDTAIKTALAQDARPTLIQCKTVIGFGAPTMQGTAKVHGAALGAEEIAKARQKLGWKYGPFEIPPEIYDGWNARDSGRAREAAWTDLLGRYAEHYPTQAAELRRRVRGELPAGWQAKIEGLLATLAAGGKPQATRKSSQAVLNALAPSLPELFGGSADLTGSNNTDWKGDVPVHPGAAGGNYLSWGVREFGMSGALNGMTLHGGLIPYGGTFLVFSDYARNAVRVAALMGCGSIFVYSHDSVGLGEDGPTHQPVEHLAALRLIPNLNLWRPADAFETAVAWRAAIERRNGPSALILSRQNLPQQLHTAASATDVARGGYVVFEPQAAPRAILIATGSEVGLCVEAATALGANGTPVRVVSMPCVEIFRAQDAAWREQVLPKAVTARLAVEAGVGVGWREFVGCDGDVLSIERFGESAPGPQVMALFGYTSEEVERRVHALLQV